MSQEIIQLCSTQDCVDFRSIVDAEIEKNTIKIWRDDTGSDIRIFNAERKIPALQGLYDNMVTYYTQQRGEAPNYAFLMVNRVVPKPNSAGSGGGWHRDSWINQNKVFAFLSDVSEENGPFEYIPGTGNILAKGMDLVRYGRSLRTPDARVADKPKKSLTVTAGQGIYLDTTVLHRGRPIEAGQRYAATLYAFNLGAKRTARSRAKFNDL
mgnify:CR=1 FL=1